jgi:hypothetical protein
MTAPMPDGPNPASIPFDSPYVGLAADWDDAPEDAEDWPFTTEANDYEDDEDDDLYPDEDPEDDPDDDPPAAVVAVGDGITVADTTADEPPTGSKASREAAKYRTRLREVEAERDTLTRRVTAYEHAQVDRIAADARMANPGDFRLFHGDLDALRGEDGALDEAKVRAAVAQVLTDRPYLRRLGMAPNPAQGTSASAQPLATPIKTWAAVLRQR